MDARKNQNSESPQISVRVFKGAKFGEGVKINFNVTAGTHSFEIKSSPTPEKKSVNPLVDAGSFKPPSLSGEMTSRIIAKIKFLMNKNEEYKENWSKLGSESQQKIKVRLSDLLDKPELIEKFSKLTGLERNAQALEIATTIVTDKKGFANIVDIDLRDYFTPENTESSVTRKSVI